MSYISDFKSSALSLFGQATSISTGTGTLQPEMITQVGQAFVSADGREFRIVSNAAVALVSGVLVQSSALVANHQNLAVAVPAATPATAGTFRISVTLGATKLNVGQYAGGYAVVNAGTGIGQCLRIASNPAAVSSGAGTIITLEDAIVTTLDATSKVSLLANIYQNVVVNPTTSTGVTVGVTLYPLAASVASTFDGTSGALTTLGTFQYGFVLTKGIGSILSDASAPGVGQAISPSTVTAGSIMVALYGKDPQVGRVINAAVSAESRGAFLDL